MSAIVYRCVERTDGKEIFYRSRGAMMRVAVETEPTFVAARPAVLFQTRLMGSGEGFLRQYDLSPDGKRFVMIEEGEPGPPPHTSNDRLIATVAHELQHAVEVAEHPEVTDASSALELYRRIAFGRCRQGLSEECETTRALATERKALEELWQARAQGPAAKRHRNRLSK